MDAGVWTFRCRKCAKTFELLLSDKEHAGTVAKEMPCPNCGLVPAAVSGKKKLRAVRWHHVIGFRCEKTPTKEPHW